jgi:ferredoxin-thioredoxin reductase catalytic subunit
MMPAFDTTTGLYDYFRHKAQDLNCNPCMDRHIKNIELMNDNGESGKPVCLCKMGTTCPCEDVNRELEADGVCYCGIFERV